MNQKPTPAAEWEKEFLKWVHERDDDWWEDEQRISIWDVRVIHEFFEQYYKSRDEELIADADTISGTKHASENARDYQAGFQDGKDSVIALIRKRNYEKVDT